MELRACVEEKGVGECGAASMYAVKGEENALVLAECGACSQGLCTSCTLKTMFMHFSDISFFSSSYRRLELGGL